MSQKFSALPYYGGKSPIGSGVGPWIASELPWTHNSNYVEPFAGILGVLLCRGRVKCETVNDLDGNIVAWWRALRDEPDKLFQLIANTPYSRSEFEWAIEALQSGVSMSNVRRALCVSIVLSQSMMHGMNATKSNWSWHGSIDMTSGSGDKLVSRLMRVRTRIAHIQIENIDAIKLLGRLAEKSNTVIYCDPPYRDAKTDPYARQAPARSDLITALTDQKGSVAISGYGDEWDELGWRRVERKFTVHSSSTKPSHATKKESEVLWCNFDPVNPRLF